MNRSLRNGLVLTVLAMVAGYFWLANSGYGSHDLGEGAQNERRDTRFDPPPSGDTPAAAPKKIDSVQFGPGVEPGAKSPQALGNLNVSVTWAADEQPAVGVKIRILRWGPHGLDPQYATTDETGTASVVGVEAGRRSVSIQRGGFVRAEVEPNKTTQVQLQIPRGTMIAGTVEDETGKPIPNAAIWLSGYGNTDSGSVVADSATDGSFRLRDVGAMRYVGARAPGFEPSTPIKVTQGGLNQLQRMRVVLRSKAPLFIGQVVSAGEGAKPLEGVQVILRRHPEVGFHCVPSIERTNHNGEFKFEGVWRGRAVIWIRGEGYARTRIDLEINESTQRVFRIDRGASIRGTVRDQDGSPVPSAIVALQMPRGTPYPVRTRALKDGSFELADLGPGTVRVRAAERLTGRATGTVELQPGHFTVWNPVLDPGLTISGRLLDEMGEGLSDWLINARHESEETGVGFWRQTRSGADGSFRLVNIKDLSEALEISAIYRPTPTWRTEKPAMAFAGAKDVLLQATPRPKHSLRAKLHGPDGPRAGCVVHLRTRDREYFGKTRTEKDGGFGFSNLQPGEYLLEISRRFGSHASIPVTVITDSDVTDYGVIDMPAASLTIKLNAPTHELLARTVVTIYQGEFIQGGRFSRGMTYSIVEPKELIQPLTLPPGTYKITVKSALVAAAPEVITLVHGEKRTLTLDLAPRQKHHFQIVLPKPLQNGQLRWRVLDRNGVELASGSEAITDSAEVPMATSLPPGEDHSISVRTESGKRSGTVFSVRPDKVGATTEIRIR